MNYKKGYYAMFNKLTDLINQLESVQSRDEQVNVLWCLKQIQVDSEEICISDMEQPPYKALRSGRA